MNSNSYQETAYEFSSLKDVPDDAQIVITGKQWKLVNMVLGMVGEAGEVADMLKKHLFQGHPLDEYAMGEEVGDTQWYVAGAAKVLGYYLDSIQQSNIRKLTRRYPNGFEAERSVNRSE